MKERIQKILANAGVASRRNVEQMVREGRIAVNDRVAAELPVLVDPDKDMIAIDGEPVRLKGRQTKQRFYLLMNKPKGVVSTNVAQGEQVRAIDLLPPGLPARVYPVGRLDAHSQGLLLLTNDGELTNRLTHPRFGVPKTYRAVVDGYIKGEAIEQLQQGVWLADPKKGQGFKTGRSRVKIVKRSREKSVLEVTLREGRNRQVRRMLAKLGHKVQELTRIRMGPLTLAKLKPGEVRALLPREVRELRAAAGEKPAAEKRTAHQRNAKREA